MKGILSKIKKGASDIPKRVLLYGVEGIGKSTFGASAPKPLFLCAEDGLGDSLNHIDRIQINDMDDVYAAIDELTREDHEFQTVVIDTADWLESLIYRYICKRDNKDGVEDYGYGKGYVAAQEALRTLHARLDDLRRAKKMGVIVLAHAQIKPFNNPMGDNYDRYIMKGHEKLSGLWKEWVDIILFARYETFVQKESKKDRKGKAILSNGRIMHTSWSPAWDGKNRSDLPEVMALDYAGFADALANQAAVALDCAEYIAAHFNSTLWADDLVREKALIKLGGSLNVPALLNTPLSILQPAANFIKTNQPTGEGEVAAA